MTDQFPSFAELADRAGAPADSSWGLFGADDEIGTLNFIGPEQIVAAAKLVRSGRTFNLDTPMNHVEPYEDYIRRPAEHHLVAPSPHQRDDWLDSYFLQSGAQIDGLRHHRHPLHGFYNFTPDDEIAAGTPRIGIQRWSERGIVGRAVLLDVGAHLERAGTPIDPWTNTGFGVDVLESVLRAEEVELRMGDVLLIRTGWLTAYGTLDADGRAALSRRGLVSAGLARSREMLAWLWDHRIAALVADNPTVEAYPPVADSPFELQPPMMHPILIALLGMMLGELWGLDALASDCQADGRFDCLLVSKPLFVTGGVGSPPNALAIK